MLLLILTFISPTLSGVAEQSVRAEEPSYVEIDFSPLPQNGKGRYKLQFTILTTEEGIKLSEPTDFDRKGTPEDKCQGMADFLGDNHWKTEIVEKTKLRVYGYIHKDKLIPVTKAKVESKDLKPEELPKVKNPSQA